MGHRDFKELIAQVDRDLGHLEDPASHLEARWDSLAEVVLQNHRGLDLLSRRQGGLCVTLGETAASLMISQGQLEKDEPSSERTFRTQRGDVQNLTTGPNLCSLGPLVDYSWPRLDH